MWPLCHTLMVKAIIETRKLKTSQISLFLPNPATLHISITFFFFKLTLYMATPGFPGIASYKEPMQEM